MKLIKKIILTGKIIVETGLHIGGSSTSMNIGETDLNVIKSPMNGEPIIPGSSLKGKLRTLLGKLEGSKSVASDSETIRHLFGSTETKDNMGNESNYITRLIVRDAFLVNAKELQSWDMENEYTENKWENTIDRKKGGAEHPRQLERVPKGAAFRYEMILDVYDEDKEEANLGLIKQAMNLLEDDYLGGNGTRGYGKVRFEAEQDVHKLIESYAHVSN